MNRLAALVGIDAAQWLALTRTYLLMDFRRGGGAQKTGYGASRSARTPAIAMMLGALANSLMIALLVYLVRDTLTAAVVMVSMGGATTSMLLMIDFAGSVIAAEDYWVLAPRPVSSRTYFAARLTAVLAYIATFSCLLSLGPAAMFLAAHDLGLPGFAGAVAAMVLSSLAGAGLVIGLYTSLVTRVSASRLVPVISLVHLSGSMMVMTGFLFVMKGFDDPNFRDLSISGAQWFWLMPATWFAALIPTVAGVGGATEAIAAVTAVLLTGVLLWLACGQISLDSASRLSDSASTAASPTSRRLFDRIPGFQSGEAYVVATLIRAQFRHDLRFRLAILGVLPMTVFYMFLGWEDGLLSDPFSSNADGGSAPLYMALGFLPMVLHGALQTSDGWKASWVFWAAPSDPARLVVAAKNFVAVFFLGAYLLMLAAIWAMFYERVWHAVVHAAFLGAGAHMLLQGAVMAGPALPFAREPKRGEQSGRLFWLFMVGSMFATLGPAVLPSVYARPWLTVSLAMVLVGLTMVLEKVLARRTREHFSTLEFT